jgi:hypothetical protein
VVCENCKRQINILKNETFETTSRMFASYPCEASVFQSDGRSKVA